MTSRSRKSPRTVLSRWLLASRLMPGCLALLTVLFVVQPLHPQSGKAELFGTVRDPKNLPISAGKIELTNTATQTTLTAETGLHGIWHFFALSAGSYSLSVSKDNFSTLRRAGIVLRVGDQ